jgi:Trypsin-like peptidase domain
MRRCLLSILALVATSSGIEAACVDPSALVRSTVNISREFDAQERQTTPELLGVRGTGWFLSARLIVTAAHVAEAMHLAAPDWKEIEIRERDSAISLPARILRLVGSDAERIAVLELEAPFPHASTLVVRTEPLVPEEPVVSLAYPNSNLRFARGRFVEYGTKDRLAGAALFELHDGNDRLVLDHGASGAPVLDCQGRVAAVVSTLMTQTINLPSGPVRVSTAWQTPNVISIPAAILEGATRPE